MCMHCVHIYIDVQVWIVDNTFAQVCIIVLQAYIITQVTTHGYIAIIMYYIFKALCIYTSQNSLFMYTKVFIVQ